MLSRSGISPARNRGLRITFVLPAISFTGGVRVVYEHTRQLARRGHEVRIVAQRVAFAFPWSKSRIRALKKWVLEHFVERSWEVVEAYGLVDRVSLAPRLDATYFPDGDILVATAWQTADAVASAPDRCGRGCYFLQHYEAFTPDLVDRVDATWRLPLERIVIAEWLMQLAHARFGLSAHGPVSNGIDLERFHPRGRKSGGPVTIGMIYELQDWKGFEDGFEAVRLARKVHPTLRLHLFGKYRLRHRLQPWDRFERNPSQDRIPEIFRECDIFLSPSWSEGWGLPSMEAMACGCAAVATNVGGIPKLCVPGVSALTVEPRAIGKMAEHLVTLASSEALRSEIARAGMDRMRQFTWDRVSGGLEEIFRKIVDK